ncbi:hypothetical protein COU78_06500 [Candidatus Peregrinibacteria bacterium CG10_big_fil_rev_8_21_14_0_10_49_24]|nr:MAG: hypothetical protein COV83_00180 [Candidatus Peregrinibacteria bacterium CG11_big_fil_rev_8_21_14_0_20_49_14]PIR50525.1 MAG: hypothetical protein COU78_06500 [Candidatus Peregrinibacteria bacterium CG10_big_fil_rev_8_21_14_0_10_49_24]PJA67714.1 MAG: hypothetical protein CO157_03210 [Candidatus Peregrinibacteria bacterium CG_4_9_14_3_um_filter_49_12]
MNSKQNLYLFLIPLFALVMLAGCSKEQEQAPAAQQEEATTMSYEGEILSGKHTATIRTSLGDIVVELDADNAPKTVTNFIALAKEGYYDNLLFHRVIPDFMIQGGDPNGNGTGGSSVFGETFEDEINAETYGLHKRMLKEEVQDQALPEELAEASLKEYYEMLGYHYSTDFKSLPMGYGYLAMANRGPNTNGSQFFVIQRKEGTPWLEGKHTVFGKVTEGLDVLEAIAAVERGANDKPVEDVTFSVIVSE